MAIFKSLLLCLPFLLGAVAYTLPFISTKAIQTRQIGSGTLFGPITLPAIQISNISLTFINFGDEVFDISSISIFGDINDGGECNEAPDAPASPESRPSSTVVLGPVNVPASIIFSDIQVTLINFADEVFDISSISVFGDINDGSCPPAQ